MIGEAAEKFLQERYLVERRAYRRRVVLGCLGCRWMRETAVGREPVAYAQQIADCSSSPAEVVRRTLQSLVDVGVLNIVTEGIDRRVALRPPRNIYVPVDSELGRQFAAQLESPIHCGLESDALPGSSSENSALTRQEAMGSLICGASAGELQWVIDRASQQLELLQNKPPA